MRDNLFRGKLTEKFAEAPKMRFDLLERGIVKDGFVYGSLVVDGKRCFICISAFVGNQSYVNNACATMFEVAPETVGQCTGLTDKNGIEIFEGDILKGFDYPYLYNDNFNYFAEVVWLDNCPAFGIYTFKSPESKAIGISEGSTELMEEWYSSQWEVIGNIYDNPELLEG